MATPLINSTHSTNTIDRKFLEKSQKESKTTKKKTEYHVFDINQLKRQILLLKEAFFSFSKAKKKNHFSLTSSLCHFSNSILFS